MQNAIFGYATKNLGDDVQSIAAALLLPRVDTYVDRDALDLARLDEPHRLIMNSWFAIKRYTATPSENIAPIYFGQCVGRPELLNPAWLSEWRRNQPIGCRDRASVKALEAQGIQAYFTGCLTAHIGRFIAKPKTRNGILFVDVPDEMEQYIPADIRGRAIRITNETADRAAAPKERLRSTAKLLDQMRTAEMVVTRRLHAALPCVGFETPLTVYLSDDPKNRGRFSGHDSYLPMVLFDEGGPIGTPWITPSVPTLPTECIEAFARLADSLDCSVTERWTSVAEFVEKLPEKPRHTASFWKRLLPTFGSDARA